MPTTRAHSAGIAPDGRNLGASDYLVLKAGYSIGGKTGTPSISPPVRSAAGPYEVLPDRPERRCVPPGADRREQYGPDFVG